MNHDPDNDDRPPLVSSTLGYLSALRTTAEQQDATVLELKATVRELEEENANLRVVILETNTRLAVLVDRLDFLCELFQPTDDELQGEPES